MSFSSFCPHRETEMKEHTWMVPLLNKMLRCVAIFFLAVPVHVMCGESLLFLDPLFFRGRTVIPKLCETAAAQVDTWALFSVFTLREASWLTLSVHNVFKCLYEAGEKKWGTDEGQFMTILCTRNRFHLLRGRSLCCVLDFFPCLRTILPYLFINWLWTLPETAGILEPGHTEFLKTVLFPPETKRDLRKTSIQLPPACKLEIMKCDSHWGREGKKPLNGSH